MATHKPMTSEAFAACLLWMILTRHSKRNPLHPRPDPNLLTVGLPQGPLLRVAIEPTDGPSQWVAGIVVRDRQARGTPRIHQEAKPRWVDLEALLAVRLLLACGNTIFLDNSTHRNAEQQRHYLEYGGHGEGITLRRIIAGADIGERVPEATDHHDLRRGSLSLSTGRDSDRTRGDAVRVALETYDRNQNRLRFDITRQQYEDLLWEAFDLLDTVPRGLYSEH